MFRRLPSLSALRTLEAAARLGSFKDAAEELSVTPTAVSHQIKSLEAQLGVALFVRRTRRVEPTDAGRRLAAAVNQGLSHILIAVDEEAVAEKILTISTTPAFGALWLVPRLPRFQKRYPDYRVRLETDTVPIDLQRDRRVDLAIRYGAPPRSGLHETPLPPETFGAYASPHYVETIAGLDDAVLFETDWAQQGLRDVTWRHWLDAACLETIEDRAEIWRFDQEHHVVQCGVAGKGLILSSSYLVSDLVREGFLQPYRADIRLPGLDYAVLMTEEAAASRKCRDFREWIVAECRQAGGGQRPA